MDVNVVKYPILTWPFWFGGIFFGVFAVVFMAPFVFLIVVYHTVFDWVSLLAVATLVGSAVFAIYALGLAISKPVGLRIDPDGISGYFAPSLRWDEIERVEPFYVHKGSAIGIMLKDPEAWRAKQTGWGRLRSALFHKSYDATVNTTHMRERVEDIAAHMRRYLH